MQAQLHITRSPQFLIVLLFVLAIALLIGGTVGYLAKPASVMSGSTHYLVVPAGQAAPDGGCQVVHRPQAC